MSKIFWSWQSDTPGKIGRHFVRDALSSAIECLQAGTELQEPVRDEIHLDYDRKGVPGSPDLANTILGKIRESAVFVADVTPVGQTRDGSKKLINSNVAIELGFALAHLTDSRLLMVLNTAFGSRTDLPFDLRQKAGPIEFRLPENAPNDEKKRVSKQLSGELATAIRACLLTFSKGDFQETEPKQGTAFFADPGENLAPTDSAGLYLGQKPAAYLRLIPHSKTAPLRNTEIKDLVCGIELRPLRENVGGGASWDLNPYGGITFSEIAFKQVRYSTGSQLFRNREIWGIDETCLAGGGVTILQIERLLATAARHYTEIARGR